MAIVGAYGSPELLSGLRLCHVYGGGVLRIDHEPHSEGHAFETFYPRLHYLAEFVCFHILVAAILRASYVFQHSALDAAVVVYEYRMVVILRHRACPEIFGAYQPEVVEAGFAPFRFGALAHELFGVVVGTVEVCGYHLVHLHPVAHPLGWLLFHLFLIHAARAALLVHGGTGIGHYGGVFEIIRLFQAAYQTLSRHLDVPCLHHIALVLARFPLERIEIRLFLQIVPHVLVLASLLFAVGVGLRALQIGFKLLVAAYLASPRAVVLHENDAVAQIGAALHVFRGVAVWMIAGVVLLVRLTHP